jgi:hypothetical protein
MPTLTFSSVLTDYALTRLLVDGRLNSEFYDSKIGISTQTTTPDNKVSTVTDIKAVGYVPSGVTGYQVIVSGDDIFIQIQNRIDAIGVSRTFETVVLLRSNVGSASNTSITTNQALAYAKLDTPCTQGAFEVLDIKCNIPILNTSGEGIQVSCLSAFARRIGVAETDFIPYSLRSSPFILNRPDYRYLLNTSREIIGTFVTGIVADRWVSITAVNDFFKLAHTLYWDFDFNVGHILNYVAHGHVWQGTNALSVHSGKFSPTTTNPVQTIFRHGPTATVPFFDSLTLGTTTGAVAIAGTWDQIWPDFFRIDITTGGDVGTAQYKFRVRKFLGFAGNNYTDAVVGSPFLNTVVQPHPNIHGWQQTDNHKLRWSETQIVQYDATGVTLLDVYDGTFTTWDAGSTSALTATNIKQCAVDPVNNLIYVACRTSGLWEIDVVAETATILSSTPCYGVDLGRNARAYAVFEGRLSNSDNFATALSFTFTGISDSNWDKVLYVKADPEHANDRLGIVYSIGGTTAVCWWQQSDGVSASGPSPVASFPAGFEVSETGSVWALEQSSVPRSATYGSTSTVAFGSSYPRVSGYYQIAFVGPNVVCKESLRTAGGTVINSYTALPDSASLLMMNDSVALSEVACRVLFTDNNYIYKSYGWNGSAWELGHAGSKVTHAGAEPLLNGLTIAFSNGTTPSFTAGDFFTFAVANGLVKDNATRVDYSYGFYVKPIKFEEPLSGTVPASAPHEIYFPHSPLGSTPEAFWVKAETHAPQLTYVTLDGTEVLAYYFDATAPGPGEVQVDGANNKLIFNASDAGKTIGGHYAYLLDQ